MNIFKLLATAAVAAATIATPSLASLDAGEVKLADALENAGGEVYVGEGPTDKAYGLYNSELNAIAICTNVAVIN